MDFLYVLVSRVNGILKEEGLDGTVKVHQIFIKNMQISKELQEPALNTERTKS